MRYDAAGLDNGGVSDHATEHSEGHHKSTKTATKRFVKPLTLYNFGRCNFEPLGVCDEGPAAEKRLGALEMTDHDDHHDDAAESSSGETLSTYIMAGSFISLTLEAPLTLMPIDLPELAKVVSVRKSLCPDCHAERQYNNSGISPLTLFY